jgi:hypothetical protein
VRTSSARSRLSFPAAHETAQGLEDLDVDQMRRVNVTVICQALHELQVGRPPGEHSEHRGRVDDNHRASLAIATGAHGGNDG